MYFKDFPQFLYDFNYGNKIKTSIVRDVTRNVRLRKEILQNVTLFDEYDIVDGETPEMISEKFYGTPEYHWVIMLANGKYDYRADFPMIEPVLQRHIADIYNPTLYSNDWYWKTLDDGLVYIYIRITSTQVPFEVAYLPAPVNLKLSDSATGQYATYINYPDAPLVLDETTQYFYFPYDTSWGITQFGVEGSTSAAGVGNIEIKVETTGREFNPVYFINTLGQVVNPSPTAIPVTGDIEHRYENDQKRRIKIISPSLLEALITNFKDEL